MNTLMFRLFVGLQNKVEDVKEAGIARLSDQDGAEVIQFIMIAGIIALIIAALFFSNTIGLKGVIEDLGREVARLIGIAGTQTTN